MELLAVTLVHGRYGPLKLFAEHMQRLKVPWVAAVTDKDITGREMCRTYAYDYIETANKPLGRKWNKAMEFVNLYQPKRAIILGSDDLVMPWWIEYILGQEGDQVIVPGCTDIYDLFTGEAVRVKMHRPPPILLGTSGMTLVGRAAEEAFWPEHVDRATDTSMLMSLKEHRIPINYHLGQPSGPAIIATKSGNNVWDFDKFRKRSEDPALDDLGRSFTFIASEHAIFPKQSQETLDRWRNNVR